MTRNLEAGSAEPSSYEELYTAHHGQVVRVCRLLLADRHEADEVAQEVFLKMFQEYQTRNGTQPMAWGPWLTRVSVNACHDRRRSGWWKWWRSANEGYVEANYRSPERTPEDVVISRETQGRIWRAFRELSARQREVFFLRHLEERSTEEVAGTLEMTTGSVKRHLFRAVRHLRRLLGDRL